MPTHTATRPTSTRRRAAWSRPIRRLVGDLSGRATDADHALARIRAAMPAQDERLMSVADEARLGRRWDIATDALTRFGDHPDVAAAAFALMPSPGSMAVSPSARRSGILAIQQRLAEHAADPDLASAGLHAIGRASHLAQLAEVPPTVLQRAADEVFRTVDHHPMRTSVLDAGLEALPSLHGTGGFVQHVPTRALTALYGDDTQGPRWRTAGPQGFAQRQTAMQALLTDREYAHAMAGHGEIAAALTYLGEADPDAHFAARGAVQRAIGARTLREELVLHGGIELGYDQLEHPATRWPWTETLSAMGLDPTQRTSAAHVAITQPDRCPGLLARLLAHRGGEALAHRDHDDLDPVQAAVRGGHADAVEELAAFGVQLSAAEQTDPKVAAAYAKGRATWRQRRGPRVQTVLEASPLDRDTAGLILDFTGVPPSVA